VINALVVALAMKRQNEVIYTLKTLEKIWSEYQVYSGDEIDRLDENSGLDLRDPEDGQNRTGTGKKE
jgi:hypothetical protein